VYRWKPVGQIAGTFSDFYRDNFNNIYVLNSEGQVKKLNVQGDSVGVYNDIRKYGPLYSMDVTNPLKVLIYYRDFNTIVTLDRFLNVQNALDLKPGFLTQVRATALSYDNYIWLFDELENRIKKIDDRGNVLMQSSDFRLLFNNTLLPEKMIDNNGQLYLYDQETGWYVFDYYGAFKQKLPYTGWVSVSAEKDYLSGISEEEGAVYLYNQRTAHLEVTQLPVQNGKKIQKALCRNGQLMLLDKQALYFYSLTTVAAK
jgi:hypothetical protein